MLTGGSILWMDKNSGHYKTVTLVTVDNTLKNDREMKPISDHSKVIYREMYIWFCMHIVKGENLEILMLLC